MKLFYELHVRPELEYKNTVACKVSLLFQTGYLTDFQIGLLDLTYTLSLYCSLITYVSCFIQICFRSKTTWYNIYTMYHSISSQHAVPRAPAYLLEKPSGRDM